MVNRKKRFWVKVNMEGTGLIMKYQRLKGLYSNLFHHLHTHELNLCLDVMSSSSQSQSLAFDDPQRCRLVQAAPGTPGGAGCPIGWGCFKGW